MSEPLFQTVGTGDYHAVCKIHDRDEVYHALGLYSDYLNWNVEPEIERDLRAVLCRIYGHVPYSGFTWKPLGYCYWCFQRVLTDEQIAEQLATLPPTFQEWHARVS